MNGPLTSWETSPGNRPRPIARTAARLRTVVQNEDMQVLRDLLDAMTHRGPRSGWSALEIEINRVNEISSRLLLVRPWRSQGGAR